MYASSTYAAVYIYFVVDYIPYSMSDIWIGWNPRLLLNDLETPKYITVTNVKCFEALL